MRERVRDEKISGARIQRQPGGRRHLNRRGWSPIPGVARILSLAHNRGDCSFGSHKTDHAAPDVPDVKVPSCRDGQGSRLLELRTRRRGRIAKVARAVEDPRVDVDASDWGGRTVTVIFRTTAAFMSATKTSPVRAW